MSIKYSFCLLSLFSAIALGKTYPIAEKDILTEIQSNANNVDTSTVTKKPRGKWSAFQGHPLPEVTEFKRRSHIPFYTTPMEIKNADGSILYPKGFTFNPLEYVYMPYRVVVFKLDQLPKIKHLFRPTDRLIADSGDVIEVSEKENIHVYMLDKKIVERLNIKAVPSIITQQGKKLIIEEFVINEE